MPPLDARTRRRLSWFAAMAAPVVTVQAVKLFDVTPLDSAPAAVTVPDTPDGTPGPAPAKLTPEQTRARAFYASFRPIGVPASPMDQADAAPTPTDPAPVEIAESPRTPEPDPLDGLEVTAIVGRDKASAVAMIEHHLRRAGDEVAPGWRVESIDPRSHRVTVVNQAGERRDLNPADR